MFDKEYVEILEANLARELAHKDLAEQVFVAGKLTPREFATWMDTSPQMIYYYIRTGTLKLEYCNCGRKVLDVDQSTEALQARKKDRGKRLEAS